MVRLPKNLSNTLSFKSGVIKTGASVLETKLLGEKAYSLGLAAKSVEKVLTKLKAFKGTESRKSKDVKLHPIIKKMIGDDVLTKMGAKISDSSGLGPQVKTKIVKSKKKAVSDAKKVKAKKVVN